jgi:hypothetical protein
MNDSQIEALAGARKIVSDALLLQTGDVLTIFFDELTESVHPVLSAAAQEVGITPQVHFVPLDEQRRFNRKDGLDANIGSILRRSRAILTCLSASGDCTAFRTELVRAGAQRNKRVGHMPGVTLEILALVPTMKINYKDIESRCDDLALALTFGTSALVRTFHTDPCTGTEVPHDLRLSLGGPNRPAVISPGRIPLGRWGNLPGGETFIAPLEGLAEGRFAITGAFKGKVFGPNDFLILHFARGRLEYVSPEGAIAAQFQALFARAESLCESSWRMLAELGIGANPGIQHLTGVSIFDEKCLGTLHIALGDNSAFGGSSRSSVHEDLVTLHPSLWIDDNAVLQHGVFVFNPDDWREDVRRFPIAEEIQSRASTSIMRGLVAGRHRQGCLMAEIEVGIGRLCSYTVGDLQTARLLARIYSKIPTAGSISIPALEKQIRAGGLSIARPELERALSLLKKHRLVAIAG